MMMESDRDTPSNIRHPVLQWLIYGHLWLVLAVVAQILWTGLFLHEAPELWRYTTAAALGTFAGYATMRLARVDSPEAGRYLNLIWYKEQRKLITALVGVAGSAALVLMWPLWRSLWHWLLPVVAMALLYLTPFTSGTGRGFGLRSIPFLKVLLIPGLWVIVCSAVPMRLDLFDHAPGAILAFACMRLPLVMALTVVFDIRDSLTDDPALRTMPQVFGIRGAKVIASVLLLCSALYEVIFLRTLGYPNAVWSLLVAYVVALGLTLRARPVRDPIYYALYVDGVMILIPLCAWIGTLV